MAMLKRYLTDEEQRRLLAAAKGCAGPLALRDHSWMRLLIETGMRVNELATLSLHQAQQALVCGWLVVLPAQRKGGKRGHEYLVTEPVRQCLGALLRVHEALMPMWFLTQPGGVPAGFVPPLLWGRCGAVRVKGVAVLLAEHMSVRSLQARMKHWAYLAGLPPRVSPHWLRHTRGVNIINRSRGANPLKVVQEALGHASLASTGIYTQMSREAYTAELHQVAGGARMPMRQARAFVLGQQGAGL